MQIYIYVRAWPMDIKIDPSFSKSMGRQAIILSDNLKLWCYLQWWKSSRLVLNSGLKSEKIYFEVASFGQISNMRLLLLYRSNFRIFIIFSVLLFMDHFHHCIYNCTLGHWKIQKKPHFTSISQKSMILIVFRPKLCMHDRSGMSRVAHTCAIITPRHCQNLASLETCSQHDIPSREIPSPGLAVGGPACMWQNV